MKIILCGFGGFSVEFYEILKDKDLPFPKDIMFENLDMDKITISDDGCEMFDYNSLREFVKNKPVYFKLNKIIYLLHEGDLRCFYIEEVDTSRPWTIEYYDGASSIEYIDYTLKDKDVNYWS